MDTNDDGIYVRTTTAGGSSGQWSTVLPPPGLASFSPPFAPQTVRPQDGAPTATVVPSGTTGKRSKGKIVGGLIAVVALLGAGGFAVSKIVCGRRRWRGKSHGSRDASDGCIGCGGCARCRRPAAAGRA